jgi:defect-in-organelle-trafficking protein DotC
MKILLMTFISLMVALDAGCNTCKNQSNENIHIAAINQSTLNNNVPAIRYRFLTETATLVGAQGGLAWRSEQINCILKREQQQLDEIYNFRALMLKDDIRPPVLEEGRQELNLEGCESIRTADQIFRIVQDPCFVTAPPNWREFLMMKFCRPEQPDITLLPKNREEAAIWNCYVAIGWKQGIEQANQIFAENLARLKRDYNGMVLYRKLLAQNIVTPPYVAKAELGITGTDRELRINDRILKIAAVSKLNTNPDTWKPVVPQTCPNEVCAPPCLGEPSPPVSPPRCARIYTKRKPPHARYCK